MPIKEKDNDNINKYITIVLAIAIIASVIIYLYITFTNTGDDSQLTEGETVLTLVYGENSETFNFDQLLEMESITDYGGYRTNKPSISGTGNWTGITVLSLVNYFDNAPENYSLEINTSDGETQLYSYDTVNRYVDIYDPVNASNSEPLGKDNVTMIVAYQFEGNYFDESKDGKLRIAFVGKEGTITSAGLWWKFVNVIEIIAN